MKKVIRLIAVTVLLILTLTACGSKKTTGTANPTLSPSAEPTIAVSAEKETAEPEKEEKKTEKEAKATPEAEKESEPETTATPKAESTPAPTAQPSTAPQESSQPEKTEETVKKPTFMYFVTNDDLNSEVIEKLKNEFGEKVTFDIKNVDEDAEVLENFSIVNGNTPALIMLNKDADISNFLFKTKDYETLKKAIEQTLAN